MFAGELRAGVVLGRELEVAVLFAAVWSLILDPNVGELDVTAGDGEAVGLGNGSTRCVRIDSRRLLLVEEALIVAFELVIEHDTRDARPTP